VRTPGLTPEQKEATANVFKDQMGNLQFSKMNFTDPDVI